VFYHFLRNNTIFTYCFSEKESYFHTFYCTCFCNSISQGLPTPIVTKYITSKLRGYKIIYLNSSFIDHAGIQRLVEQKHKKSLPGEISIFTESDNHNVCNQSSTDCGEWLKTKLLCMWISTFSKL
jgi:hypothetical protein